MGEEATGEGEEGREEEKAGEGEGEREEDRRGKEVRGGEAERGMRGGGCQRARE